MCLLLLLLSGAACGPEAQEERTEIHNGVRETLASLENIFRDNPDSAIKQAEQALAALAAYPDPELEIRLNTYISICLAYKTEFVKAEKKGLYALKLAEYHRLNIRVADAQITLGQLYWRWKNYDQGLSALFTAHSVLKGYPGENERMGRLYNLVGLIYWELYNLSGALEQFIRAEDYFRRGGYIKGLATTTNNIGLIYEDSGNSDSALKYFLMAEDLYRRAGWRRGHLTAAINIANQYNKTGYYEKSLAISEKARREAEQLNDISSLSLILNNMSFPYMYRKEFRQARQCLDQSLLYSKKINDKQGLIRVYDSFCEYFIRSGQYGAAEKTGREALEMASAAEMNREKKDLLLILSKVFTVRGKYREALQTYKEYLALSDSQLTGSDLQKAKGLAIQYEAEKSTREILWLKQSHLARELELEGINAVRAVILMVIILALALILLLYTLYRFKIRRQRELEGEIAAHKLTQKRLRESEKMFRTLAARAPLGVFILQAGAFKYINPQIAAFSGYPSAELLHRPPAALIHPDDRADALSLLNRDPGDASPLVFSIRSLQRNGEVRQLEIHAVSLYYEEKPAMLGAVVDVTHTLQIKKALWAQQEHESVARLAGGIAHDFNNMLAVIIGYLNMALDPAFLPHPAAVEKINRAERAAQQMAELIRSILRRSGYSPESGNDDAQLTETGLP